MSKTRQLNFRPSARAIAALEYLTAATGLTQTAVIERALLAAEKRRRRKEPPTT